MLLPVDVFVTLMLAVGLLAPLALLLIVPWFLTRAGSRARWSAGAFVLTYAGWVTTLWNDPGRFLEWLID